MNFYRERNFNIARELIELEGLDPETLSIHEHLQEWADDNEVELTNTEFADIVEIIRKIINSAEVTISFPGEK